MFDIQIQLERRILLCAKRKGLMVVHKERKGMSYESLSHSKWDCKYHIVFIPKGRKKGLYGKIRKYLGPVLHDLAQQRGSEIVEGHMVVDHVHMLMKIPPKYAVAEVIGYIKGKSAIAIARQFGGAEEEFQWRAVLGQRVCGIDGRV